MTTSRRQFLATAAGSTVMIGAGSSLPSVFLHASENKSKSKNDHVLVVIQLSGGNDGLNTVIPFADDDYYKNRFTLAIGKESTLAINDHLGFHPSLDGFSKLFESGQLAIVNGVGYPNPNRSHFESMDLWHTAHRSDRLKNGWLGQYVNQSHANTELPAIHFGDEEQPLALLSEFRQFPSIQSLERFRLHQSDRLSQSGIAKTLGNPKNSGDTMLSFIRKASQTAMQTSDRVERVLGKYKPTVDYPQTTLGRKLLMTAQLIDSGLETKVFYVTLDGFDTHSKQADAHASLLSELGDAVSRFLEDMTNAGHGNRVLTFAFSEFGRRVKENASLGTDHGAAAPVFLAGGKVNPGVFGDYPSLADLQDGDLRHHTDYRQIYATLLEKWLGAESGSILGKRFKTLDFLS